MPDQQIPACSRNAELAALQYEYGSVYLGVQVRASERHPSVPARSRREIPADPLVAKRIVDAIEPPSTALDDPVLSHSPVVRMHCPTAAKEVEETDLQSLKLLAGKCGCCRSPVARRKIVLEVFYVHGAARFVSNCEASASAALSA
ncbi:hypothetical protein L917_13842 [Phytophthora nicotianae]|uniref:Uncharacterized protein n=1 Tax=Phytophthora nicotianae TaxID=4792 RepID=W2KQA3_PHYNI|nr:hypothetical protein L917_13842 [Phytophthora nicotianae]